MATSFAEQDSSFSKHPLFGNKDGKGASDGHNVFHKYAFDEVEARYVRVIAKGANTDRSGRKGSTMFHMSRVHIVPEPQFEPAKPVPEVTPVSLYRQQLKERYQR